MLRSLVVPILFSVSALAGAQTLNFADVKAKNAKREDNAAANEFEFSK
jgi:hypothetical protein